MIEYTVFNNATGAIVRTGSALTEKTALLQGNKPGTSVKLVGSDPVTEVVEPGTGSIVDKLPMRDANGQITSANKTIITANGVDAVTISNVPVGAIYEVYLPANLGLVQPPDGIVNDGVLIITTTVRGLYQVKLRFQNFLDFGVSINAN